MFIAVVEYENFRCFIHFNAVKLFSVKNKKMNKMQMRTIYFPMYYIIWQILQNSRKFFFYLSNYLTIHLYLYNFEFLQNLKGTEEEVPPIPTTELDPNREKTFILFTHVDRKTVTLQNMWSVLKRKWKSQPLVCQFYTEFSIV